MTNLSKSNILLRLKESAPLAQLDRALVYGTKGQEFESLAARQQKRLPFGSLFCCMIKDLINIGSVDQRVGNTSRAPKNILLLKSVFSI